MQMYLLNDIYHCCIAMKTLKFCSLLIFLISYADAKKILKNCSLHVFLLIVKLLKAIASLVAIVAIFVKIIWFLKRSTCANTNKKDYVKGELNYNSCNVIYLVVSSYFKHQCVGFAFNFSSVFRTDLTFRLTEI